jgi:hypothetical protein
VTFFDARQHAPADVLDQAMRAIKPLDDGDEIGIGRFRRSSSA